MAGKTETWCDRDEHNLFEFFVDFNEWLESDEGAGLRERNVGLTDWPSRAKPSMLVIKKPMTRHFKNTVKRGGMRH